MRAFVIAVGSLLGFGVSTAGENPQPTAGELEPFPVVQSLKIESGFSTSFALSPDGHVLAVADGVDVRFWNPRTGTQAAVPWRLESDPRVTGLATFLVFVDNKTLAMSRNRNDISLREYPSGREIRSIDFGHSVREDGWAAAPGSIVCAGYHDNRYIVRLMTGPEWQEAWRADLGNEFPRAFVFSPDRSELAIGTNGGPLRVYSVRDGKLLRASQVQFVFHGSYELAYSPDGREIACVASARAVPGRRPAPSPPRVEDRTVVSLLDANLVEHRTLLWGGLGDGRDGPLGCAFSADGKTLIVPCHSNSVRLYEVQTGKFRHVGAVPTQRRRFAVSPDGKWFAFADAREVSIMDWREPKLRNSPVRDPDALWADLVSPDSAKAYQAVVGLGTRPTDAAKLIGDNLKPVTVPKATAVNAWITDLAADDFATRETAQKELAKLIEMVEPELRGAAKSDSPERRQRANELLTALSRRDNPERLRGLRAVEVLEYIDTPASREVLKALACGAPAARLTADAKAALARLEAFERKP
jgi:hypothetical protein